MGLRLRRRIYLACVFMMTSLVSVSFSRAAIIDANIFYFTSDLSEEEDASTAVTAYAFFAGFSIDKKGDLQVGWNYASYATTDETAAATVEYASSQMGPALVWFMDKSKNWRLGLAYNLVTTGTYDDGTNPEEEWEGTGTAVDLGYDIEMGETFRLGIRLNYTTTSYSESKVDTTADDVSYSKTMIYPSFALSFLL